MWMLPGQGNWLICLELRNSNVKLSPANILKSLTASYLPPHFLSSSSFLFASSKAPEAPFPWEIPTLPWESRISPRRNTDRFLRKQRIKKRGTEERDGGSQDMKAGRDFRVICWWGHEEEFHIVAVSHCTLLSQDRPWVSSLAHLGSSHIGTSSLAGTSYKVLVSSFQMSESEAQRRYKTSSGSWKELSRSSNSL